MHTRNVHAAFQTYVLSCLLSSTRGSCTKKCCQERNCTISKRSDTQEILLESKTKQQKEEYNEVFILSVV